MKKAIKLNQKLVNIILDEHSKDKTISMIRLKAAVEPKVDLSLATVRNIIMVLTGKKTQRPMPAIEEFILNWQIAEEEKEKGKVYKGSYHPSKLSEVDQLVKDLQVCQWYLQLNGGVNKLSVVRLTQDQPWKKFNNYVSVRAQNTAPTLAKYLGYMVRATDRLSVKQICILHRALNNDSLAELKKLKEMYYLVECEPEEVELKTIIATKEGKVKFKEDIKKATMEALDKLQTTPKGFFPDSKHRHQLWNQCGEDIQAKFQAILNQAKEEMFA